MAFCNLFDVDRNHDVVGAQVCSESFQSRLTEVLPVNFSFRQEVICMSVTLMG